MLDVWSVGLLLEGHCPRCACPNSCHSEGRTYGPQVAVPNSMAHSMGMPVASDFRLCWGVPLYLWSLPIFLNHYSWVLTFFPPNGRPASCQSLWQVEQPGIRFQSHTSLWSRITGCSMEPTAIICYTSLSKQNSAVQVKGGQLALLRWRKTKRL